MIILQVIFFFLLVAYLFYVSYFIIGWVKTKVYHPQFQFVRYPTVTIIVPVRNEEEHIEKLLKDIRCQSYPSEYIQVFIIDDDSTDQTVSIINKLNDQNVRIIPLKIEEEIYAYKKRAITLGIENASSELIITTDGDCRMGVNWVASIVDYYLNNDVKLILAPVTYYEEKQWFEKIQTVEFQFLIGAAAACLKNGMPNTCNGANMAYTRELFYDIGGYEGIDIIASGDDEMLLHKIFRKYPKQVGFLKSRFALVSTYAKSNFIDFIQQRKRWASKSSVLFNYQTSFMVIMIFLFNLSLVLSLPLALFFTEFKNYLLIAVPLKVLFDAVFIIQTLVFFKRITLLPYIILVEFFYSFYLVYVGLMGNFSATYIWKGRRVK